VINSGKAVAAKVSEVLGGPHSRVLTNNDEFADRGGADSVTQRHFLQLLHSADLKRRLVTYNPDSQDLGELLVESSDPAQKLVDQAKPFDGESIQAAAMGLTTLPIAVDGTDPVQIKEILDSEVEAMKERHGQGRLPFELMAKYGPCFGLIATLVGQVLMLRNLDADTATIGAGMSMAMLGTFYGATSAFLIFGPLADNLRGKDANERHMKAIIIKGIMSIQSGDNPRVVEQRLKTLLPPSQRKDSAAAEEKSPARKAA
jgi:biopolymer transport protein ExbB/TolQ